MGQFKNTSYESIFITNKDGIIRYIKCNIFHSRTDIQQNIQDRYGNRYDPRFHSIPGKYDPENDPRFSDPRYQDPRNLPKYENNRHRVPQDRYDSKYRYYER